MSKVVSNLTPSDLGLPPKFQTWRPGQWAAVETSISTDKRFVACSMPTGCHEPEQGILMLDGSVKKACDVRKGDLLMGPDSKPREVLKLYNGRDGMWSIQPVKGSPFTVNSAHVLSLVNTESNKLVDLAVSDYLSRANNFKHLHKLYRIGVTYQRCLKALPLCPYFLGVYLGDGSSNGSTIALHKGDPEIKDLAHSVAARYGLGIRVTSDGNSFYFNGSDKAYGRGKKNPIRIALEALSLHGLTAKSKFVPWSYMIADESSRLSILAGLLDTDGSLSGSGYDFISKSERLSRDVATLARSLSLAAYVVRCQKSCQNGFTGDYWRVSICGHTNKIPCRLPRKKAAPRQQVKDVLRTGFSLVSQGEGEYYGFGVDGDNRYLLEDFTVTHNSGKSPMAVSSAILTGGRSVYLTATKALQNQLNADFSSCGMFDMRGRNNYYCAKGVNLSCAEGSILECKYADCPYGQAKNEFLNSDLSVTNYAYYLSSVMHSEGVGNIGLLIMDEAHSSIQELSSALEISLDHSKNDFLYNKFSPPPYGQPLAQWRTWAQFLTPKTKAYLTEIKASGGNKWMATVHRFITTLGRIAGVPEDWILDQSSSTETLISPLWPTDYADQYLFRAIPHILLVSATLVPKTLSLLGISEDQALFLSSDHTFDSTRCPVYLFGPCRVDHKMSDGNIEEWIGRMDTIIAKRLDRKGIIHTVSYRNQQTILSKSEHRNIMIAPESAREFNPALAEFRHSQPPRILITPTATTGYDFPGEQAEYQILAKVPFIDSRSPVMAARVKADPEYLPYLVAQTLVQTCGRAMRGKDDRVENFILDAHANWFFRKKERGGYRHLFPSWFLRQLVYPDGLPSPKPKL